MKTKSIYLSVILMAVAVIACDDNEVMPSFTTVGTATHTMADIAVSNTAPVPSENVSLLVSYVNPSSDPLKEIRVLAKTGAGDYVEIQKFDISGESMDEMATKTFSYTAPASSLTTVVFDMVITSQREYPQIQRTQLRTK